MPVGCDRRRQRDRKQSYIISQPDRNQTRVWITPSTLIAHVLGRDASECKIYKSCVLPKTKVLRSSLVARYELRSVMNMLAASTNRDVK